jgi:hypothetical protein
MAECNSEALAAGRSLQSCKAAKLQRYKAARMQDSKKYWRNIGALGTRKQKEVGGERRSKEKQKVTRETKA